MALFANKKQDAAIARARRLNEPAPAATAKVEISASNFTLCILAETNFEPDYAQIAELAGRALGGAQGRFDGFDEADGIARGLTEQARAAARAAGRAQLCADAENPARSARLMVDGMAFGATMLPTPFCEVADGLETVGGYDPEIALRQHEAQAVFYARDTVDGLAARKRQAAVLLKLGAMLPIFSTSFAAYWRPSRAYLSIDGLAGASEAAKAGRVPLDAWLTVAPVSPFKDGLSGRAYWGAATRGLTPFLGRELELAPAPRGWEAAVAILKEQARAMLERGARLTDGARLDDGAGGALSVREADRWLRPTPVWVLVSDDSAIDAATLEVKS